jgi:hypothetical protein
MTELSPIGDLIDLTERLTEVMAREVALLDAMRPSEIGPLQSEKATLSAAYAGAVGRMNKNPALVDEADPGTRDILTRATAQLNQTMADNLRAIDVAKTFNERLIRALGEAVAESRPSTNAYTAAGGPTSTVTPATPAPIALDDRI